MIEFSRYSETGRAVMFMSRFGEALAEQREVAGYEKQGEAANASTKLASEYPDLFQPFSQQWLSRLESDVTGDHIKKSQPLKLLALAYLLKLDSADFYEKIGVHIAPVPLRETPATAGRTGRRRGATRWNATTGGTASCRCRFPTSCPPCAACTTSRSRGARRTS